MICIDEGVAADRNHVPIVWWSARLRRVWPSLPNRSAAVTLLRLWPDRFRSPILDLGSGVGGLAVVLASRGHRIVALDLDIEQLRCVQSTVPAYRRALEIRAINADGALLPFKEHGFNTVICNSVLEHIEDDRAVIHQIARVMSQGGVLLITVPNSECRFGHYYGGFWQAVWRFPMSMKRYLGNSVLLGTATVTEAGKAIDASYRHVHLYTADSMREILKPYFVITDDASYMRHVGALVHDLMSIGRPSIRRVLSVLSPVVIYIDQRVGKNRPGKGIALSAVRTSAPAPKLWVCARAKD